VLSRVACPGLQDMGDGAADAAGAATNKQPANSHERKRRRSRSRSHQRRKEHLPDSQAATKTPVALPTLNTKWVLPLPIEMFKVDFTDSQALAQAFISNGFVIVDTPDRLGFLATGAATAAKVIALNSQLNAAVFQQALTDEDGDITMISDANAAVTGLRFQYRVPTAATQLKRDVTKVAKLKVASYEVVSKLVSETSAFVRDHIKPVLLDALRGASGDDSLKLDTEVCTLMANHTQQTPIIQPLHTDTAPGVPALIAITPLSVECKTKLYLVKGSHRIVMDAKRVVYDYHAKKQTLLGDDKRQREWHLLAAEAGSVLDAYSLTVEDCIPWSVELLPGQIIIMHGNLVHAGAEGIRGFAHERLHIYFLSAGAQEADETDKRGFTYPVHQMGLRMAAVFGADATATITPAAGAAATVAPGSAGAAICTELPPAPPAPAPTASAR
jgi:ectoine hydroxylase-related dioxygenase (phytanoyl-CoA dioxygenase family)